VVSEQKLHVLIDAAERDRLGWDANGIVPDEKDVYLLLPYSYEARPVPSWKCRLYAFTGGLSVEVGKGKRILYGRLDVSLAEYRRLPTAPERWSDSCCTGWPGRRLRRGRPAMIGRAA
jgi:hypothetical protein